MDKKNTPEVKLGQYKGLAVTRHVRPVTDKTVDIELVHQARMHAVYHPTTEPAKRGFRALLDFAGYMDGKEIPDSRMEKVMVVLGTRPEYLSAVWVRNEWSRFLTLIRNGEQKVLIPAVLQKLAAAQKQAAAHLFL